MMPIFVASASASSIKWEVNITAEVFLLVIPAITDHMKRLASGSIPAEGSSRRIIGGLPTVQIATDTLRLFPPDSVPACFFL